MRVILLEGGEKMVEFLKNKFNKFLVIKDKLFLWYLKNIKKADIVEVEYNNEEAEELIENDITGIKNCMNNYARGIIDFNIALDYFLELYDYYFPKKELLIDLGNRKIKKILNLLEKEIYYIISSRTNKNFSIIENFLLNYSKKNFFSNIPCLD